MLGNIQNIQKEENSMRIDEVERKLTAINEKIRNQQFRNNNTQPFTTSSDWTTSYKKWNGWSDVEELIQEKNAAEAHIETLHEQKDALGHVHDHSKEREFFLLKEEEKIDKCLQFLELGNYLLEEGMFDRAAIQFRVVLGYYEYIFPEDSALQRRVDEIRFECLCNISKCYIQLKEYRMAIETCSEVVGSEIEPLRLKALLNRGIAYRMMDEFENALNDLQIVQQEAENKSVVDREIEIVKKLAAGYAKMERRFAASSLEGGRSGAKTDDTSDVVDIRSLSNQFTFLSAWKVSFIVFYDSRMVFYITFIIHHK
jgi:tetratricopeptide (TPR) repeat protein